MDFSEPHWRGPNVMQISLVVFPGSPLLAALQPLQRLGVAVEGGFRRVEQHQIFLRMGVAQSVKERAN
jgi:hypothetical protein